MRPVPRALLAGDPVDRTRWRCWWDELAAGTLEQSEARDVLSCLAARLPSQPTFSALVASLRPAGRQRPRRPGGPVRVNIVGTGGGPLTFNISTGAAIVAAAVGVPVVKSGSSAHSSRLGSIDLLRRLGVRLSNSAAETDAAVQRVGIAFAGGYVYPPEFVRLARLLFPEPLRAYGRFFNLLGPLVADVGVDVQVSGISSAAPSSLLRRAAADAVDRPIWWVANDLGTDELISFAPNRLYRPARDAPSGFELCGVPASHPAAPGSLADLAPCADTDRAIDDFEAALAGRRHRSASETLALNAAAVVVAGGYADWPEAYGRSLAAIEDGTALALLHRLRADPQRNRRDRPLLAAGHRG